MLNLSAFKVQNPSLLKNLNQFQQVIQLFRNHSIPPLWIGSTDQLTGSNLLAGDPPRVRRSGWDLSPLAMDGEGSRGNVDHTHPTGKSSACDFWQWAELFCLEIEFQTGRSHHVYDEPSGVSFEVMRGILAGLFIFLFGGFEGTTSSTLFRKRPRDEEVSFLGDEKWIPLLSTNHWYIVSDKWFLIILIWRYKSERGRHSNELQKDRGR